MKLAAAIFGAMADPAPAGAPDLPEAPDAVQCGPLWLSPGHLCEIRVDGEPLSMTISKIQMVACLLAADGAVVSREGPLPGCPRRQPAQTLPSR